MELREGNTWETTLTWYPMLIIGILAYAAAWTLNRRNEITTAD